MKRRSFGTIFIILVSLILSINVFADTSMFEKVKDYNNNFNDVEEGTWYTDGIILMYETGLMDGVNNERFDTDGSVTVAQGITIASRLHSIYNKKEITDSVTESGKWYDKYILYAIDNSIITDSSFLNYDRDMLTYEIVNLFDASLPHDFFKAINNVTNLPDVTQSNSYYESATRFYNAGILNGNDKYGTFFPMSKLSRKRMATILGRIVDESLRLEYTLETRQENYSLDELVEIVYTITSPQDLDGAIIMKLDGHNVSAATYRRYYKALSQNIQGEELKQAVIDNISFAEAVRKICVENNITLPYEYLRSFLSTYYNFKISYGEFYDTYLSLMNATDRSLCEQEMLYTLYSYALNYLFGYGAQMSAGEQEILLYLTLNDYIRAKHIFISAETDNAEQLANEIHTKAISGENFDKLIEKYGQDPSMKSKPEGYHFTHGVMVENFEEVAYALEVGEISGVVQTEYGYHIIKREEFDFDIFKNSSDFVTVFGRCSSEKGNKYFQDVASAMTPTYIKTFDEIVSMFDN